MSAPTAAEISSAIGVMLLDDYLGFALYEVSRPAEDLLLVSGENAEGQFSFVLQVHPPQSVF